MDVTVINAVLAGIGSAGMAAFAATLFRGFQGMRDGSYKREQRQQADLAQQRDRAWARLEEVETDLRGQIDAYSERARLMSDYATALRHAAVTAGVDPAHLPAWPTLPRIP